MSCPTSTPSRRTAHRLLMLSAAVLGLHLGLWAALAQEKRAATRTTAPSLAVRTVAPATPPTTALAPTPVHAAARATPTPSPVVHANVQRVAAAEPAPRARRNAPVATAKPEAPAPAVRHALYQPEADSALESAPAAAHAWTVALPAGTTAPATSDIAALEPVPVYRTRMPPPLTVRYSMQRGMISGRGELVWQPQGSRYLARMEGRALGMTLLTWRSEGGFDNAGLAPLRFTDKRWRKSEVAANFQRSQGKITYSGPTAEFALVPGAQDRLSWMIQLAAIAAAEPQRVAGGQRLSVFVSGARGDADVWAFRVLGAELVSTGTGKVQAVKLLREPRKPHDTRVEVWLGPQQQYLPVRVRLSSDSERDALEFILEDMILPSS